MLIPEQGNRNVYLYNSSYNPNVAYPDSQPPTDRIDIVKVPSRGTRPSRRT